MCLTQNIAQSQSLLHCTTQGRIFINLIWHGAKAFTASANDFNSDRAYVEKI
jgi:hypothetical protein